MIFACGTVAPNIHEVGSNAPRSRRNVVIGEAQGNVMIAKDAQACGVIPTLVSKLKDILPFSLQQLDEAAEEVFFELELRRQLEQYGPDLWFQNCQSGFHEI